MNEKKKEFIEQIKKNNPDKSLIFIHTPKCGGTYLSEILKDLNIQNKNHNLANKYDGIHFTIIREPADRFESLLNYRLDDLTPRSDWPKSLYYVYNDNSSLNEIVEKMSDLEIISFTPYKSLSYWSENVDIFITINEVKDFLEIFDYTYDEKKYESKNVSQKKRGKLNQKNRERICKLYENDVILFNKWTKF
jgi:hypothetical protein